MIVFAESTIENRRYGNDNPPCAVLGREKSFRANSTIGRRRKRAFFFFPTGKASFRLVGN